MTDAETQTPARTGRTLTLAVLLAAVGGAAGWFFATRQDGAPAPAPQTDLAYLNLGPDATYVGSDACKTCHADEHEDHGSTPHGRSLRKLSIGPDGIPSDALPGRLDHEPSGLSYRIAAEDGRVRVREVLALDAGGEELLGDHVLTYAFGSGEHDQCFLAEPDGFLVQAPIARARGAWSMAPDYDAPLTGSFGRPVGRACLACHAGRATNEDGSLHRITFQELAISCERCHGPGSLHVAHQEKRAAEAAEIAASEPDLTIVNPAHLTQARSVEVCTQCHVDEGMTIQRAGRNVLDWRPGQPLSDYRLTYRPKTPTGEVPTVGHGEQLGASKCFQASPEMDCSTCHDAHSRPSPAERAAHYANKCASCHGADGCALDAAARRQSEGGDDCTTCHMPRAEAYVHHGTFTHHRIGIHGPGDLAQPLEVGAQLELVLLEDAADRTQGNVERDLALAHLRLAHWRPAGRVGPGAWLGPHILGAARKQVLRGLTKAEAMDSLDAEGKVALAMLIARTDTAKATRLLTAALDDKKPLREETAAYGRVLLARAFFEPGEAARARPVVEALTRMRRSHEDWEFMVLLERLGDDSEAILRALQKVLEIRPHVESTHFLAAEVFHALGHGERAEHHQAIANQMSRHLTDERAKAERRAKPK